MSFTNPPAKMTEFRTALLASTTFSSLGILSAQIHYPTVDLSTATFPLALVGIQSGKSIRVSDGEYIGSGELICSIRSKTHDIGQLETAAESICADLVGFSQGTGEIIFIEEASYESAQEHGIDDTCDYCSVKITCSWSG
jgi:hypothetical protein